MSKKDIMFLLLGLIVINGLAFGVIKTFSLITEKEISEGDYYPITLTCDDCLINQTVELVSITFELPIIDESYEYKGIKIYSDEEELAYDVMGYLNATDDLGSIEEIYLYSQDRCLGKAPKGKVLLSRCSKNQLLRNTSLNADTWIPFVLYHEIGHAVLGVDNDYQCVVDEYAHVMMQKLNISVERKGNCMHEHLAREDTYEVGR